MVTAVSVSGVPLLPGSFAEWKPAGNPIVNPPGLSLANVNKEALEEDGPLRSQVANYVRNIGGNLRSIHVEAIQFGDRTGALSAFTLVERAGMREGKELGDLAAVDDGVVLFTAGSSVVLVNGTADVASLKPLADGMPKVFGSKSVAPILPTILPVKGLVGGSLRYALGPASYKAEAGVLPANSVGWDKSAEAVTAQYDDARGKETLTVLMYPTPAIAGEHAKAVKELIGDTGSSKVRREGVVVALATGSFAGADAQKLVESVHLKEQVVMDKELGLTQHEQVMQGYSLLKSITILALVLIGAAFLLGIFLGGGRAAIRVMRGKPAAVEVEFLSLHLSPQNKPAQFGVQERGNSG
jgi:hypothetical protein